MITLSKLENGLIIALVALCAFGGYTWHERNIGAQKIVAAVKAQSAKDLAAAQKKVDQSHEEALHAQTALDDYTTKRPVGTVRLCHDSSTVPQAGSTRGVADQTTGAGTVPGVSEPAAGPDISAGLTVIVSAAAELAIVDAERASAISK